MNRGDGDPIRFTQTVGQCEVFLAVASISAAEAGYWFMLKVQQVLLLLYYFRVG
jgi:hypothetical protein